MSPNKQNNRYDQRDDQEDQQNDFRPTVWAFALNFTRTGVDQEAKWPGAVLVCGDPKRQENVLEGDVS